MFRRIIHIDEEKCTGCGACAAACHEGAIGMVEGKAKLLRDDYCDGLGDCLPACPADAITLTHREAAEYDEAAALEARAKKAPKLQKTDKLPCGCPGSMEKKLEREHDDATASCAGVPSQLNQWPVQIKLVNSGAIYFDNADLLIAADCSAYAYGDFHREFIRGRITIIGCPKLDEGDYTDKLTEIISRNNIKSVTIVRMEVPCCSGIENAAKTALQRSGKFIPWQVVTLTSDGRKL